MESEYNNLKRIVADDIVYSKVPPTTSDYMGKLVEELGEFAKEVNKLNGRKTIKPGESYDKILNNAISEATDATQCIMGILILLGVKYEDVVIAFQKSNGNFQIYTEKKKLARQDVQSEH